MQIAANLQSNFQRWKTARFSLRNLMRPIGLRVTATLRPAFSVYLWALGFRFFEGKRDHRTGGYECFRTHLKDNMPCSRGWFIKPSSVTTFWTDFSFQNLGFWNLFEFSAVEITLKSISPTFWIQILPNKFH